MEEKVILVKSDIEAKTIEYDEIKIQSDDMSFSLDGFKMKVKMFEELSWIQISSPNQALTWVL